MQLARIAWALALATTTALAAGCGAGGQYVYQPLAPSGKPAPGGPAARYALPAEAPAGELRIGSPGIVTMTNRDTKRTYHALQVAMSIRDDKDTEPWRFAPYSQLAFLPERGWVKPFLVTENGRALRGDIEIARGKTRTLQLFYALPPTANTERLLSSFAITWQVETPSAVVVHDTRFQRLRVPLRTIADEPFLLGAGYYDPVSPMPVWFEPVMPAPR